MSELLETIETKRSLNTFLIEKRFHHFQKRGVRFVVGGNEMTYTSFQNPVCNNHEEADMLIIHVLCILTPINQQIVVHSVDTNSFALLLRHYDKFACRVLYMKLVDGFANLTSLSLSLDKRVRTGLLALHALTGCDTTGKFSGMQKGT